MRTAGHSAPSRWRSTTCAPVSAVSPSPTCMEMRLRGQVRAYASSRGYLGGLSLQPAWSDEARTTFVDGFRAIKLRIGKYPVDEEIEAIQRVVTASPTMTWMADGNGAYDLADSRRLGAALEELGFRWLEEPLPTERLPGLRAPGGRAVDPAGRGRDPRVGRRHGALPLRRLVRPRPARRLDLWRDRRRPRDRDGCPEAGRFAVPHACSGAIALAATFRILAASGPAGRAHIRRADPRARRRRGPDPNRYPDRAAHPGRRLDDHSRPSGPGCRRRRGRPPSLVA